MKGTNLYWFIALPDKKYEYRRATYEKLKQELENNEILGFTIVHPDNPMYANDVRKFNRRYQYLIDSKYAEDLSQLLQMEKKPATIIASGTYGVYSKYRNLLEMKQIKKGQKKTLGS